MTDKVREIYVYWDASAILSTLVADSHSTIALKLSRKTGLHLLSSLAYSEVLSVLDRLERERVLTSVLARSAFQAMLEGPWRFLTSSPTKEEMDSLRGKHSLRGADFWHLALTKTLRKEIPELTILTFDKKLKDAAETEGLVQ